MYIEQYTDKIASLNVAIAGSIVFHQFAVWAKFQPQKIKGFKFEEGDSFSDERSRLISQFGHSVLNDPVKKREERQARKKGQESDGEEDDGDLGLDFDGN